MGTLKDNLKLLEQLQAHLNYELSEPVLEEKRKLGEELAELLDNEDYEGFLDLSEECLEIGGKWESEYSGDVNMDAKVIVCNVYATKDGDFYVEDDNGYEHYFEEDITLYDVKAIVDLAKSLL